MAIHTPQGWRAEGRREGRVKDIPSSWEAGIRKDFLADDWKNDHAKGKEALVSQAEERTCTKAERQSHAVPLGAQNLPVSQH